MVKALADRLAESFADISIEKFEPVIGGMHQTKIFLMKN